ncbi:MAG: hypothetical protein CFE44_11800 [Burkholderiales bacterium PBB4]|nr:MAG: hypothetical protein CFE44_11800 [Burkholderiales bacterium PBB4]
MANVRLERLAMDAMLDRRERALKDVRRETQAREQLERVRQKEEEHALKLAAAGRKEGISQVEKPMKAPLAPAALRAPQSPQKPVLSELQREVKLQEFVKKQQAAHDKRIAVNARIKERDKPSVPLPRPP